MQCPESLRTACNHPDSLFALTDEELVRLVHREFSDDLDRLKRAYSIRDGEVGGDQLPSPSYILYQDNYDEVNRTLVGFLALRWIHTGQYERFIGSQPLDHRLSRESFEWIHRFYAETITDTNTLYALITSIITNDLGKDPKLTSDYYNLTGIDISHLNHDAILLKACEAGMITSLNQLPLLEKESLLLGIRLGAYLNFGQLGQAENAPVCLSVLSRHDADLRHHSFQLRFMEQLLDIAGAAGHMNWSCAKKLNQPIFQSYLSVFYACKGVLSGALTVREGYDLVLSRRAEFIHQKGFRLLRVKEDRYERGLMRLLCMGNATTKDAANTFEAALGSLEQSIRDALLRALDVDGSVGEPAVQPTYMPAFFGYMKDKRALICALEYLCRVMSTKPVVDRSAVLVERSVLGVLKQHVDSMEFTEDPTTLEGISVPDDAVAMTETTSQTLSI
ncbi:hypothetical protein N7495_005530 [Penicillium taxi]|uniref:uncharacterized protein n=1 Tax=Penicillium taxi TaxID=168475 RepID=UPI0025454A39|nr:uncharacterized protein N7495_005530 [Penicillium taxi]KAJ5893839.1 hypothetical protein N7495_005530 [Penicillium taxi]